MLHDDIDGPFGKAVAENVVLTARLRMVRNGDT